MANYVRRDGDKEYRKVSIQSEITPPFQDFTAPNETVSYTTFQGVEVQREDGTTTLFYEAGVTVAHYTYAGMNKILIDKIVPTARLWMRREGAENVAYKIPSDLPVTGPSKEFRITGGVQGMELFGDKYFNMVFQFSK